MNVNLNKERIKIQKCEDSKCREHLSERDVLKENKIKCNKCNEQFQIKNNEFKSNEPLNKLKENQPYLSEDETSLKHELEVSVRIFFDLYNSFVQNIKTKRQIIRQMERRLNLTKSLRVKFPRRRGKMSSTSFFNVVSLELHAAVSFPLKRGFFPKYMNIPQSFESWGRAQSSPQVLLFRWFLIPQGYMYMCFFKERN